ncbi:DUF3488 and transglutaminase-like domain-containing protein [Nautilia sp.]
MKYSKNWLYTDLLNLITFLPFFFVLPGAVKLFAVVGVFLVYYKKTKLLWILGFLCMAVSFYNIREFADYRVYVKFLVSLLLLGVYLQRTQTNNFYIKLSPFLFFGMSIVFFQNVYMLFYLLFEIYVFVAAVMSVYFPLKTALKKAFVLYFMSMPLTVLLFLFFPRVNQKHFIFGFSGEIYTSGFSKNADTDVKNITLTKIPVVEFKLKKNYPQVYLRGEVLNIYKNGRWYKGKTVSDKAVSLWDINTYYLKEYPNGMKYLFAIDLPVDAELGKPDGNFVLKTKKPVDKTVFIKAESALGYVIAPKKFPETDLLYDKNKNPYAQKLAFGLKKMKDNEKLQKIIEIFKKEKIVYSLKPHIDTANIVDSLFKTKKGFCVHFASAFALFCRMAGLPSRIVSGFLAKNPVNGYYKVYSKDAHVWDEVLINGKWVRIDPTSFAYKNESKRAFEYVKPFEIDIYLSYYRFLIEEWVIKYDSSKQKRFLDFFKKHFFMFAAVFLLFAGTVLFVYRMFFTQRDILEKLYKKLDARPHNETVDEFLRSYGNEKLNEINELYEKITFYKSTDEDIKKLKKLIKRFKLK